jgi:hypothetical protein
MRHLYVLVLSLMMLIGCSANRKSSAPVASMSSRTGQEFPQDTRREISQPAAREQAPAEPVGGKLAGQGEAPPAGKDAPARKVIYNAAMTVTVKNLDEAGDALNELVEQFHGYVADSNVAGSVGTRRHGLWKVRIPVKHYNAFRLAVKKLGITESSSSDSKDVSEEFYDTKARIETLKREEKSLMLLLETLAKNYSETKEVRRDLWQIREKIEQHEGRLQYLEKLTAMTTFTITLQEEQRRYVAPEPPLTPVPTFPETIRTTFQGSLDILTTVGKFATLVLVALAPWMPLLLVAASCAWLFYRRHRPVRPAPSPPNPNPPT